MSEGRVFDLRLSSRCLLTLIVSFSELGSCLSPSFCSAEGVCFSCGKPSPLLVRLAFCKLLSIGLGHLLSQVHLLYFPEVGLVNAGKEALVGTGEGLSGEKKALRPVFRAKQSADICNISQCYRLTLQKSPCLQVSARQSQDACTSSLWHFQGSVCGGA